MNSNVFITTQKQRREKSAIYQSKATDDYATYYDLEF